MAVSEYKKSLARGALALVALRDDVGLGRSVAKTIVGTVSPGASKLSELPDDDAVWFNLYAGSVIVLGAVLGPAKANALIEAEAARINQTIKPKPEPEVEAAKERAATASAKKHVEDNTVLPEHRPFETVLDIGRTGGIKVQVEVLTYEEFADRFGIKLPERSPYPPMKIEMMLHFATEIGPFAPEEQRRSDAYVDFVKELLRDGLIKRPTKRQRRENPGWAYYATEKGERYVEALMDVRPE